VANSSNDRQLIDVGLIGAGIAGVYSAWRLQQNGRTPVVFENSRRIGGRLMSVTPPGMPDITGELGGMRFLSVQQMVSSLISYLGLSTALFPLGGPNNLASLRSKILTGDDFSNPALVPYNLLPSEQGKNPGELLVGAINTVIPNATTLTPQQWETVKQETMWNGDHLYNWGLWNVLLSINSATGQPVLSSEAYALLYDGGGYESLVDNWNCAEAFEYLLIDFPSNAQYQRLARGYQTLPQTLAQQFRQNGGTINIANSLMRITLNTVNGANVVDFDVFDLNTQSTNYYRANALILALPRRALEIVFANSLLLPDLQFVLDAVMPMPAQKTLLAYSSPWWQEALGLVNGRSTTDLPIRQVYYFGTQSGPDPNSLLLATYADGRCESFWRPLWGGSITANKSTGKLFAKSQTKSKYFAPQAFQLAHPEIAPPAPLDVVETLQQLLAQMHGIPLSDIPEPYFAAHMDWTLDPYGAGWHFWQAGVNVAQTISGIRQPYNDYPLYICGEAYSNEQGWVEGALTSAEHVMQDKFGLAWPTWLPTNYYLGP
jgi:lysine 2-monooxygenase